MSSHPHHLTASPELQALLLDQEREVLRALLRAAKNAEGPLDLVAIERSIEALLRRLDLHVVQS